MSLALKARRHRIGRAFDAKFLQCSFGYRKGRSPHDAMRKVWRELNEGNFWIVDADLRQFFDSINQEKLIDLIAEEISDSRVLQLIRDCHQSKRICVVAALLPLQCSGILV